MLLTAEEISELIHRGVVVNSSLDFVNATSLDVTLGEEVLIERVHADVDFSKGRRTILPPSIDLSRHEALSTMRVKIPEEGLALIPGEFILACSAQIFNLPLDISAEYKLKSSMARVGLEHLNAGWCDPGWNGSRLTLELKNMTRHHTIYLHRGDRIGQMVFFKHRPVHASYSYATKGRYNGDKSVSGAKVPVQLMLSYDDEMPQE